MSRIVAALLSLLLGGCLAVGDASQPLPVLRYQAPVASTSAAPRVVVLPGRRDDVDDLAEAGIVEAVQQAWPQAEVWLVGATLDYYRDGVLVERLHREVLLPARRRGAAPVWLVGASMGGLGAMLYERAFPGAVDGIVLLGPYLGERALVDRIVAAGGPAAWQPGPPQPLTPTTFQHELWRGIRRLAAQPDRTARIWLVYGDRDRLRYAAPALRPLLPVSQVLEPEGGHAWRVWKPALAEVLARQAAADGRQPVTGSASEPVSARDGATR